MNTTWRVLFVCFVLILGADYSASADQIQGVVESVDSYSNTLVIKDPLSGAGKTVYVHPKIIPDVKTGFVAKATLKSGTANADTLEVLIPRINTPDKPTDTDR